MGNFCYVVIKLVFFWIMILRMFVIIGMIFVDFYIDIDNNLGIYSYIL